MHIILRANWCGFFNELTLESEAFARAGSGTRSLKPNMGAGIEHQLNKKLALRMDYIYTYYGNELKVRSIKSIADISNPGESLLNIAHAKFNDQQLLASLVIRL